ncbi:MAG: hypothetical protein ACLPPF_22715 [Rhodomicrobium sp.]
MPADAIKQVKSIIKAQHKFWSQSRGWAPDDAANLLEIARLDRQLSFANTLGDYLIPFPYESADARQILGYTTLRSMCEGAIKLFVTVYLCDYRSDPGAFKDRKNSTLINPEDVKFDKLIEFYLKKGDHIFKAFLYRIRDRGNAIHHFSNRDIGTQSELQADIIGFKDFLAAIDGQLPYP